MFFIKGANPPPAAAAGAAADGDGQNEEDDEWEDLEEEEEGAVNLAEPYDEAMRAAVAAEEANGMVQEEQLVRQPTGQSPPQAAEPTQGNQGAGQLRALDQVQTQDDVDPEELYNQFDSPAETPGKLALLHSV